MRRKTETKVPNVKIGTTTYGNGEKLGGRGQPGLAGFFTPLVKGRKPTPAEEKPVLIKQDNPGTCLAEGLAVTYLPPGTPNRKSVNTATMKEAEVDNKTMLVSMQDKVAPKPGEKFASFDTVILGHKRKPKTPISEEERNKGQIKDYLAEEMSEETKLQLAQAIYTSQLNGDESLHTGQFVCSTKTEEVNGVEKKVITDIKRIDFGALGRYGAQRTEFNPAQTSKEYADSGQMGKNYVGYLMQDPVVSNEVNRLWSVTDPNAATIQVSNQFDNQMQNVTDPHLKQEALREFNNSLTGKKSDAPVEEGQVKNTLLNSTLKRCEGMKTYAADNVAATSFENYIAQESKNNPSDPVFKELANYSKKISDLPPAERLNKLNDKQVELRTQEANDNAKVSIDAIQQYVQQNKNSQDPLIKDLEKQLQNGNNIPAAIQLKTLEGMINRDAQEIAATKSISEKETPAMDKTEPQKEAPAAEQEDTFDFSVGGIPPDTSPVSANLKDFDFEKDTSPEPAVESAASVEEEQVTQNMP